MTIRGLIALAISICSIIGLMLVIGIAYLYMGLNDERTLFQSNVGALRAIDRLDLTTRQWLTINDLIIANNETFLSDGSIEQSSTILNIIEELSQNPLAMKSRSEWDKCKKHVLAIRQLVDNFSNLSVDIDRVETNFLAEYDTHSISLVRALRRASKQTGSQTKEIETHLDQSFQFLYYFFWALVIGYICIIWITWRLSVRQVVFPIENLTTAAKNFKHDNDTFRFSGKGPNEVKALATGFQSVVDLLHNKRVLLEGSLEELKVAKKSLDVAYEAKSKFLSQMSHELRTPLNAILGYSEMLIEHVEDETCEDGALQQDQLEDLKKIQYSGQHLLGLINDVLDFSKYEHGELELTYRDVNLYEEASRVVDSMAILAEKNKNSLRLICDEEIGSAEIDQMRCRQILFNLVSNACKFTENGTVTLKLSTRKTSEGELLVYKVSDTGIGMTQEQKSKIFSPFVQADAETSVKYGGTGLGLSICLALLDAMKGDIRVSSTLHKGSSFEVSIPRKPQTAYACHSEELEVD